MNAHRLFKSGYGRRRDIALCIALLATFVLFGFSHPVCPGDRPASDDHALEVVSLLPDEVVPPPPARVTRPVIPIETELEAGPEKDEFDSTLDPNDLTAPLPPPMRAASFQVFDQPPRPRTTVTPEYPAVARQAGIEGRVLCQVTVDEKGHVVGVVILESDAEIFHRSVVAALMQWTWFPAEQSGNPVRATVVVPYEFRLG